MLLTYVWVTVFFAGASIAHVQDELIQKYGLKKIYESCFGERLVHEKYDEFRRMIRECKQKNDSSIKGPARTGFDWHGALRQSYGGGSSPLYLPVPFIADGRQPPFFLNTNRGKRAAYFDEAKVRKLKNTVIEKLQIATCVLQKKKIFDSDLNLQWNELEKMATKDYGLNRELQADLAQIFTKCKNFVMCKFMKQEPGKFPVALKQIKYFKKCEKKKKIEACIKNDLRQKPQMFELEGLDGMLDDYESDDEKMLKILKLFMKFGDDDAAFFS